MPIYEYRCSSCKGLVQVLVRSHGSVPTCPDCGSPLAEGRLFSAPHVLRSEARQSPGRTCCGQEERCGAPPCSDGGRCRHD
jgi:putative FmdB family regulatory protein